MGEEVEVAGFTRADRARYRAKVNRCLDVMRRMLADDMFEADPIHLGIEVELNLVDPSSRPLMRNERVLVAIANEDFQTELGQFNIEFNVHPHVLVGEVFRNLEDELRTSLNRAEKKASEIGAHIVMVGILPTLTDLDMTLENLSTSNRYRLINEQVLAARGEDIPLDIEGVEHLQYLTSSIAPEAATTSVQFHLQVSQEDFTPTHNAAQAIAGVQLAMGANSPFLLTKELHRETRIALFEQSTDTRSAELAAQGVRPRAWYGERWTTSVIDLFSETVRYFPPLLPVTDDEDPEMVLAAGGIPRLHELRLLNGTVYRWNRPIFGLSGDGKPHLRIENRVLPAGPTVVDTLANAALFYGLVQFIGHLDEPVWKLMSFGTAEENFRAGARDGIDAEVFWPGAGVVPVTELVLKRLLERAKIGLGAYNVADADVDRLLGIIQDRCLAHRNGASWQSQAVRYYQVDRGMDRLEALVEMTRAYTDHMHSNEPVHTWSIP